MVSAARTARSGSSSWAAGTPNSAMAESPSELLDGPAEAFEVRADAGVVGAEDSANVLGIELLGLAAVKSVRSAKQDGDELPLLARQDCANGERERLPARAGSWPRIRLWSSCRRSLGSIPSSATSVLSRLTVRRKCVRLPSRAVEGEHELGTQVLVERMLRDEHFELGHKLAGSPEGEVRVETPLERGEAELVQPGDLRGDSVLVEDVRERSPPPEGKRSSKHLGGPGGFVLEQGPTRHERGARSALRRAGRDRSEGCSRSDASPAPRPRHPPPRRAGGSARSFETWNQSFRRASGGLSGQSTSTIRSVDTTSFGCINSSASSVRCVGDPIRRRDAVVDDLERAQHSEFQRLLMTPDPIESTTRSAQSRAMSAQRPARHARRPRD